MIEWTPMWTTGAITLTALTAFAAFIWFGLRLAAMAARRPAPSLRFAPVANNMGALPCASRSARPILGWLSEDEMRTFAAVHAPTARAMSADIRTLDHIETALSMRLTMRFDRLLRDLGLPAEDRAREHAWAHVRSGEYEMVMA